MGTSAEDARDRTKCKGLIHVVVQFRSVISFKITELG